MKQYKGFTLSETLIALTIIGVVAAISIPVLNMQKPDKDGIAYRKAVLNVTSAFNLATDSNDFYYSCILTDEESGTSSRDWRGCPAGVDLCTKISDAMNTSGKVDCSGSETSYTDPNFRTTDGTIYWGLEGGFTDVFKTIYVDRKLSNEENTASFLSNHRDANHSSPGLKIRLTSDGGVNMPDTTEYKYEKKLVEDPMKITK